MNNPTQAQNKYDRQLRLWGQQGQELLQNSRICLLGGTPVGVETLKNMVLPGIGYITIVDDQKTTDRDLGNNFFAEPSDLNSSRAETLVKWLLELNPDVKGDSHNADPEELLKNKPEFFKDYTFIIASQLSESGAKRLDEICHKYNSNAILLRTLGFVGSIRLFAGLHTIVEAKPADKPIEDQRIKEPFKELVDFANTIDLKALDDYHHHHVPYTIILIQLLQLWRKENNNQDPKNFEEKQKFTELIKSHARHYFEQDNFQEAVKFAFRAYQSPQDLPYKVQQVLENEKTKNADANSNYFWIFAKALSQFVEKHKVLPVRGGVPDQHSDTDTFLALKKIYDDKAARDVEEIKKSIAEIAPNRQFDETKIKDFCKNALTLEFHEYRSFKEEYEKPLLLEVFETDCYKWHFALRGSFIFREKENRFPSLEQGEEDIKKLEQIVNEDIIKGRYEGLLPIETVYFDEMARYEDAQLHTISSLLGGVASQEIIKIITHQFTPINNTYVYNGITSEAEVYEF